MGRELVPFVPGDISIWDGAPARQRRFVELLRIRHPRADVRNLNPILDDMRSIKSTREIALIRRASQLAGLGVMEAMRSTEPGVTEYQLDAAAHYVFKVNDARFEGYRSITATPSTTLAAMRAPRSSPGRSSRSIHSSASRMRTCTCATRTPSWSPRRGSRTSPPSC